MERKNFQKSSSQFFQLSLRIPPLSVLQAGRQLSEGLSRKSDWKNSINRSRCSSANLSRGGVGVLNHSVVGTLRWWADWWPRFSSDARRGEPAGPSVSSSFLIQPANSVVVSVTLDISAGRRRRFFNSRLPRLNNSVVPSTNVEKAGWGVSGCRRKNIRRERKK